MKIYSLKQNKQGFIFHLLSIDQIDVQVDHLRLGLGAVTLNVGRVHVVQLGILGHFQRDHFHRIFVIVDGEQLSSRLSVRPHGKQDGKIFWESPWRRKTDSDKNEALAAEKSSS